jgi:hypothetical protein
VWITEINTCKGQEAPFFDGSTRLQSGVVPPRGHCERDGKGVMISGVFIDGA